MRPKPNYWDNWHTSFNAGLGKRGWFVSRYLVGQETLNDRKGRIRRFSTEEAARRAIEAIGKEPHASQA